MRSFIIIAFIIVDYLDRGYNRDKRHVFVIIAMLTL